MSGVAKINLEDSQVKLIGPQSVIGRSIVVYQGPDDFGKVGSVPPPPPTAAPGRRLRHRWSGRVTPLRGRIRVGARTLRPQPPPAAARPPALSALRTLQCRRPIACILPAC